MYEIKGLSKSFGKQQVIDNLTITFSENGVTVIVGLNGSGKTVFLNTITGIISFDKGKVLIDKIDMGQRESKNKIFYIPSDSYLPEYMTGIEYVNFIQSRYPNSNKELFNEIITILDMKDSLNKSIEAYSFGMKKKLQLALGLSLNVDYLLADELFSGLDLETVIVCEELLSLYGKEHKIILVAHERNIINRFSDDILLMKEGKMTKFVGNDDVLTKYIYKEGNVSNKLQNVKKLI